LGDELYAPPLVKNTDYLGNSVTGLSRSKGESSVALGYASFDRRNRVKSASYIKMFMTPSVKPPAKNNTHPGMMVSKGAYWQSRRDHCRFFAANAKIRAQK